MVYSLIMRFNESGENPPATIYDKFGQSYQVHCHADGMFHVTHNGIHVANLYCATGGKTGLLSDLRVEDCVPYQGSRLLQFLRLQPRTKNYENKGIGTALLKYALQHLKDEGCEKVEGKIVERDFKKNPWLPDWYRKHGFNVSESGTGPMWKLLD